MFFGERRKIEREDINPGYFQKGYMNRCIFERDLELDLDRRLPVVRALARDLRIFVENSGPDSDTTDRVRTREVRSAGFQSTVHRPGRERERERERERAAGSRVRGISDKDLTGRDQTELILEGESMMRVGVRCSFSSARRDRQYISRRRFLDTIDRWYFRHMARDRSSESVYIAVVMIRNFF